MSPERSPVSSEALAPAPLPPLLAEFLRTQELIGLTHATPTGTAFVIKAPTPDIELLRGPVQIQQRHELYPCDSAPVIRLVTRLAHATEDPFIFESFINVQDPEQRREYALLSHQHTLPLHFYDEQLQHRLTHTFRGLHPDAIAEILQAAERLQATIHPADLDFESAKLLVMSTTNL
jgi:hypothetical protein